MVSALVQSVSDAELSFIASADYGQAVEQHLAALREVIFKQGGFIREGQHWYPYEVIELRAHWLQPGHEREFAICTLLVLANAAAGVDTATDVQAKFADRAADYDQLPAPLMEEILDAYKYAGG